MVIIGFLLIREAVNPLSYEILRHLSAQVIVKCHSDVVYCTAKSLLTDSNFNHFMQTIK